MTTLTTAAILAILSLVITIIATITAYNFWKSEKVQNDLCDRWREVERNLHKRIEEFRDKEAELKFNTAETARHQKMFQMAILKIMTVARMKDITDDVEALLEEEGILNMMEHMIDASHDNFKDK